MGLRQRNTCRKVPVQAYFLDDDILHCLLYESYLSTPYGLSCLSLNLSPSLSPFLNGRGRKQPFGNN
jgi:hypothetical protein